MFSLSPLTVILSPLTVILSVLSVILSPLTVIQSPLSVILSEAKHYDIYNNTDITIYIGDANTHQNKTGAYLSALTLFCDIFNVNVEEVTYEISIPANQIAKLKAAAGKAAFDPPTIPEEYKTTPTPVN